MTTPEWIYVIAVGFYVLMFLLFARYLFWKRYSEVTYWQRRPQLSQAALAAIAPAAQWPKVTILVPARNEADVIEPTVDHLLRLNYPADRFDVLVVTDAKESRQAALLRPAQIEAALSFLDGLGAGLVRDPGGVSLGTLFEGWPVSGAPVGQPLAPQAAGLILGLVADLSLEGFAGLQARPQGAPLVMPEVLGRAPHRIQRQLLRDTCHYLLAGRGRLRVETLLTRVRRRLGSLSSSEETSVYVTLVSLAIPSVMALAHLQGDVERKALVRMAAQAARAHHGLTGEIIGTMGETLAREIVMRLGSLRQAADLQARLETLYSQLYPTTQEILERKQSEWRADQPQLRHVEVPADFNGVLGGVCVGADVPSTKGRALNWALQYVDPASQWCLFYDAESRPDPEVLLYLAYRSLTDPPAARRRIFQGPVFQVRNFYEMGPTSKIAGLFESISHDWCLPILYKRIPFVGGTNVAVDQGLLRSIGGFDNLVLTEDLELGTRAWLAAGEWPDYMPYPSSEQTPPTWGGLYRQRLRWAAGHLQVMEKIRADATGLVERRRQVLWQLWKKGQFEWSLYQFAAAMPLVLFMGFLLNLVDPGVLGPYAPWLIHLMSLGYFGFTFYAFSRYRVHVDQSSQPRSFLGHLGALAQLLLLPVAAFLAPLPYSVALLLKGLGRLPTTWVKTPRTQE